MIDVGLLIVNDVALVAPNVTLFTTENPVPVIVTLVPPLVGPLVGLIEVTAGWMR